MPADNEGYNRFGPNFVRPHRSVHQPRSGDQMPADGNCYVPPNAPMNAPGTEYPPRGNNFFGPDDCIEIIDLDRHRDQIKPTTWH